METSAKSVLSNRAAAVASRASTIEYVATKIPEPSGDFESSFKAASGAKKDFSNAFVIDVLPDFRIILCYIMFHVNQYSSLLEMTNHSKISPATFTAYCLSLVYSYILICDLRLRPAQSMHALSYQEDSHKHEFLIFMHTCPVPDFLLPVLTQLTPTTDEFRPNLYFVPSATGFSYDHHFGRFFPISMFTNIHDCVAEVESRSSREAIISDYYRRPLYTIENFYSENSNFTASPGHFLGSGIDITNPSYLPSKLYQTFTSLFNPVLLRDYQRRRVLASTAIEPQTYSSKHVNFYDLVFSASPMNLVEFQTVFQSISAAMKDNVTCKSDLASIFKNLSGSKILSHGYSQYALPTYFHSKIKYGSENDSIFSSLRPVPPAAFAKAINYLQTPTPTVAANFPQPEGTCNTDAEHEVECSHDTEVCRLSPEPATTNVPALTRDFEIFSESRHVYPKVFVLNPIDPSTIDPWKSTAFGMVIESLDIDGTVIPVPNPDQSLGTENSWFADSAIPLRYCYRSTHFGTDNSHPATARRRIIPPRQTRFPASSLLVDRTKVSLPQFAALTVSTRRATAFVGLTPVPLVTWPQMMQSFLGFYTADRRDHNPSSDEIPGMETDRLLVFSPYTYTGFEPYDDFAPEFGSSKTYFLTNLRTFFGTRVPLIEINNGFQCIPIT